MVAHLDAVTCLSVDPNGLYLLSGSKHPTVFNSVNIIGLYILWHRFILREVLKFGITFFG